MHGWYQHILFVYVSIIDQQKWGGWYHKSVQLPYGWNYEY